MVGWVRELEIAEEKQKAETDLVRIVRKCDSWSKPIDTMDPHGRWAIKVCFDNKEDAKAFAVELMMVTSGQEPYGDPG